MFFGISDVFSAWENLSGSVLAIAGAKAKNSNAIDHSYITPAIIGTALLFVSNDMIYLNQIILLIRLNSTRRLQRFASR